MHILAQGHDLFQATLCPNKEINFQTAAFKAGAGTGSPQGMISEGALIKSPVLSEVLSSLELLRFYQSESVATQKHSLRGVRPGACLESCCLKIDFRDIQKDRTLKLSLLSPALSGNTSIYTYGNTEGYLKIGIKKTIINTSKTVCAISAIAIVIEIAAGAAVSISSVTIIGSIGIGG